MASYTIIVRVPNAPAQTFESGAARVTVGRARAELIVKERTVSTRHGELLFQEGHLAFVDVGSSNGTFAEADERLEPNAPMNLEVGQSLRLGGEATIDVVAIDTGARPGWEDDEEGGDHTTMLSPDQLAALTDDAPAPAARRDRPSQPRQAAARRDRPSQPRQAAARRDRPSQPRQAAVRRDRPSQPRQAAARRDRPSQPRQAAAPAHLAPPPEDMQPVSGAGDDWATQAAAAVPEDRPRSKFAARKPPRVTGPGASAGAADADPLAEMDEAPLLEAFQAILVAAVMAALDLFKQWGQGRGVDLHEIVDDFGQGWERFGPTLRESTIPLLALYGATAVFGSIGVLAPGAAGVFALLNFLIQLVGILVTASIYYYFLQRHAGAPVGWLDAVKTVVMHPVPLIVSLLLAGIVILLGTFAVIVPGMMLGAFALPVYFAEGRRGLALARRSLWIFTRDGKRVFLSLLVFAVVYLVVGIVVGVIFGLMGKAGIILGMLVMAPIRAVLGAYAVAFILHLYLDVRARFDGGVDDATIAANLREI